MQRHHLMRLSINLEIETWSRVAKTSKMERLSRLRMECYKLQVLRNTPPTFCTSLGEGANFQRIIHRGVRVRTGNCFSGNFQKSALWPIVRCPARRAKKSKLVGANIWYLYCEWHRHTYLYPEVRQFIEFVHCTQAEKSFP